MMNEQANKNTNKRSDYQADENKTTTIKKSKV